MSDKDLKSFKISDQVKQQVKQPSGSARATKSVAEPPPSVGFPQIEATVEVGDLTDMEGRLEQLRELAKSGSNKDKLAAKKAVGAYERGLALLNYLLETKARIAQGQP